ncbi:hypothetical protein O7605_01895 [Verrucosispora sp. WMMA2121]|uniref:hypothetical protein n=1 Tax=Verrucosispora sp. WMMA2121 TaxID=3015164 RepID=UPI0022B60251|nr:hypothetical protein [Verrucosispora sp. WMMA2121]MCZ7418280.1 hypothetical protein [Verrucosispora sp. WMMA2121]
MSQTDRRPAVARHPAWCAPDRCGHLVPPVLAHMARRHRGVLLRVGEVRSSGLIVSYLIGSDDAPPTVVVHASCRAGAGWAELTLPQAAQLVGQLGALMAQAGEPGEGERGRQ